MKKLYVILACENLSDEQILDIRQVVKGDLEYALAEELELILPDDNGVPSQIAALMGADLVILRDGFQFSQDARVVHFAASNYVGENMHEEDWVEAMKQERAHEDEILRGGFGRDHGIEEAQDETVPS